MSLVCYVCSDLMSLLYSDVFNAATLPDWMIVISNRSSGTTIDITMSRNLHSSPKLTDVTVLSTHVTVLIST